MASQNIARLGVLLGLDMAQFTADMDKAVFATKRLEQQSQKANERALKDAYAIKTATEDYGKTLTKVQQIERAISEGRYAGASDSALQAIRARAKAYDSEVEALRKVNAERLKSGGGLTPQQQAQIGYQMTDIFTSLMGGQNPMMVFIQQGGQLRDVFGGAGNAIRALMASINPMMVAMTAGAAVIGSFAYAAYKGAEQMARLRDDLILTGNIAGLTKTSFLALGDAIENKFNISIGNAREIMSALVSGGKFTQTSIESVGNALAKFSQLAGVDGKEAAQKLIPLLDGTASSARQLNAQFNFLTIAQYKQIEVLEKYGKIQESIKLQSDALNKKWSEQTRELGYLEKAWEAIKNGASSAWDAMLGIGRNDPAKRIKELTELIEQIKQGGRPAAFRYSRLSPQQLQAQFEEELKMLRASLQAKENIVADSAKKQQEENKKIADELATGGLEGAIARAGELQKAILKAERAAIIANQPELIQLNTEYAQKIQDLLLEMKLKNEKEGGRLTLHNQKIFDKELIALQEQRNQKLREANVKRYLDEYNDQKSQQEEINNYLLEQARQRDVLAKASIANVKLKEEEFKLEAGILDFRKNNLIANDQDVALERIRLDIRRQIAALDEVEAYRGKDGETAKNLEIQRIMRLGAIRENMVMLSQQMTLFENLSNSVWQNMSQAIDNFVRTGKLSFKDLARSIIQDLIRIQMQAQVTSIFRAIGSIFAPQMVGPVLDAGPLDSSFNQYLSRRAEGGPVSGGTPYLVGERGPELFMPSGSGTIIPNHAMSAGGTTNVTNNYINAIDVRSFEERLLGSSNTIWAANQYAQKSLATGRGRA